jgi:putative copper export protein
VIFALAFTTTPIMGAPVPGPVVQQPASDSTDAEGLSWGPELLGAPVVAAALRGLGVGALMAGVGLLALIAWLLPAAGGAPGRIAMALLWAAVALLALHLGAWLLDASPDHRFDGDTMALLTATGTGRAELLRLGLMVLCAGLALSGQRSLAALIGLGALGVSADVGHAAAIATAISLPAKIAHLLAGAAWLGGLLWLVLADPAAPAYRAGMERVSAAALIAVLVVTASGVTAALLFLPRLRDLFHSAYGALALAKIAGVGVLVLFGVWHRYVLLPRAASVGGAGRLRRSVWYELGVMALVILIGGLLAYVSPPEAAPPL